MKQYLKVFEYEHYGGENKLSQLQLDTFSMRFESTIHPNQWMLEDFKLEHGTYPYEIKIAMMYFIKYLLDNANQIEKIPIGGSQVGSTSIDYVNSVASRFGDPKLLNAPHIRQLLLHTNIYNPRGFRGRCSGIKFIGSKPEPIPLTPMLPNENESTNSNKIIVDNKTQGNLHTMEELLERLPSIDIKIYIKERTMEGVVVTNNYTNKLLTTTKGWYNGTRDNENEYASLIICPRNILGEKIILTNDKDYLVKFEIDDNTISSKVQGYTQHLDFENKTHHYKLDLE